MQLRETVRLFDQIEWVIDIAVSLADYTQSAERCREIPAYLAGALGIAEVGLGVVRQVHATLEPTLKMWHQSLAGQSEGMLVAEQRRVLEYFGALHPFAARCDDRGAGWDEVARWGHEGAGIPELAGVTLFARVIDGEHYLIVTVRDLKLGQSEGLRIIVRELAKQLHCLIACQQRRFALGKPFSMLTDHEWHVLQGLNSEVSEKQLALQLRMRPHTLHSRIKSLYSKLEVQGRMSLIQKYHAAILQFRIDVHRARMKDYSGEVAACV